MQNTKTLDAGYFKRLWVKRKECRLDHSKDCWDGRAQNWIDDLGPDGLGKPEMAARVNHTAQYLRSRGLLGQESSVIDVGCGPGLFVIEFAKTALHAVGLDHSRNFIENAEDRANINEIFNTTFVEADFLTLDIDKSGFAGAFDLVFASITPAATGEDSLEKLMKMSRRFCNIVSFVNVTDTLAERISMDVFGEEFWPRFDGNGFYALLNLLWLDGHYPETSYYTETREETVSPDERWASGCAALCRHFDPEDAAKVLRYMEKHGEFERSSEFKYGSIL